MMDIVTVHVQEVHMLIQQLKNVKIVTLNVHNVFWHRLIVLNVQVDSMSIKEIAHLLAQYELIKTMLNVYLVHFHV
jgi:hypothetical protein